MRAWVDFDNPPQVRYLLPIARRFEGAGHDVLLTARAYGDTFALLESEGAAFEGAGVSFGKGTRSKLSGLSRRTRLLVSFLRDRGPVDFLLTGSRAAALAARYLGIPSFVIVDYEYVELLVYELGSAYILHPSVIADAVFRRRGVRRSRLIAFHGLKEDISFADADIAAVAAHEFGANATTRVLVRPPAEDSHYFRSASKALTLELLEFLASQPVQVVLSPRDPHQIEYLDVVRNWSTPPIVLHQPISIVSLLKAVDAVVSGGGTMLREAAYLGVPAFSVFRGRTGAVDRYLASTGRLRLLSSAADFAQLEFEQRRSFAPLGCGSVVADAVVESIIART